MTWLSAWLPYLTAALALVAMVVAMVYARRYVADTDVTAQLSAKNTVITTNEQTIRALTKRVEELEEKEQRSELRILKLEKELEAASARYAALEMFAAPKALGRVMLVLEGQDIKLGALIEKLLTPLDQQAVSQRLSTRLIHPEAAK